MPLPLRPLLAAVMILGAGAGWAGAGQAEAPLQEMEVMGVAPDPGSGVPLLFLRSKTDKRELSMYVGPAEATAIAVPLEGIHPGRPTSHDLMLEAIHRLRGRVKRVVITELKGSTYLARLVLEAGGEELALDSRPSDAIALALREGAPIWAAEPAFRRPPPGPQETP